LKSKILIRTDGSPQIGLGHLVRCTSLAHMLKDDFEVTFFCKEIPETIEKELSENNFVLVRIEGEVQFFEQLQQQYIVVLDGYHFDTAYQKQIKAKGCKLVCIDDLHDQEFMSDLIINHAPGITPKDYNAQPYTKFALGLEYALLRPAFLEQAKKHRKIEKIETLIICFGGSDFKNFTQSTLQVASEFNQFNKIIVVTGAAYQATDSFRQLVSSDPRIDHRHNLNEKQMLAAMLEAELAIVPSSGILFEALAAGCVVISGYYINNQLAIYKGFREIESFFDIGRFADLNKGIKEIFSKKRRSFVKSIDGKSNVRIRNQFIFLSC